MDKTIVRLNKNVAMGATQTIPYVHVLSPNQASKVYRLQDHRLTVGRDKTCQIVIDDVMVSREHCQLWLNSSGKVVVRDMNSTNGTIIDDNKIVQDVLSSHSRLKIGNHIIKVEYKDSQEIQRGRLG
jgi:pSer/pThr/pTyr-binding forkhead associated (FHA) protein